MKFKQKLNLLIFLVMYIDKHIFLYPLPHVSFGDNGLAPPGPTATVWRDNFHFTENITV